MRSGAQRLAKELEDRVEGSARRNPARLDLVEQLRRLIETYNAGSLNVDELLRRLQALSQQLSEDEQRTAREGLTDPELAIFDLLTKPDPTLTEQQRAEVKKIARKLMEHITERLVLDWRKKAETREAARVMVRDILEDLPEAYDPETWQRKSDAVFNHIFASYYDDGGSVYEESPDTGVVAVVVPPVTVEIDIEKVTEVVIERIRSDPELAGRVARQLTGRHAFFAVASRELIAGEETYAVEFKSTARWNLREQCKDQRMEDAIVKTIAGFLNADGGTLLIGVDDRRNPIGLDHDVALVKPPSVDGLVSWLTTHLIGALSHTAVSRTRARIDEIDRVEICRMDTAPSPQPVFARMSDKRVVFWVRLNNTTRALPAAEIEAYIHDHW